MKILILGAGATLAEAKSLGVKENLLPPVMKNFITQSGIWDNFNPHPFLDKFLEQCGYTVPNEDGIQLFIDLERNGLVNIEKFFQFCWDYREKSWSLSDNPLVRGGQKNLKLPDFWNNMMYHGFGVPFTRIMIRCFFEDGKGVKELLLSKKVAATLKQGDLVLNLNYDTVFELALSQIGCNFLYSPAFDTTSVMVCKPHGSLNMVINPLKRCFSFGSPEYWGCPEPGDGWHSYTGLIPPRFDKKYNQNPHSEQMLGSIKDPIPDEIIFWGIGLTESDIDLVELFKKWSAHKPKVSVVNPDSKVKEKIEKITGCLAKHFLSIEEWLANNT